MRYSKSFSLFDIFQVDAKLISISHSPNYFVSKMSNHNENVVDPYRFQHLYLMLKQRFSHDRQNGFGHRDVNGNILVPRPAAIITPTKSLDIRITDPPIHYFTNLQNGL